MISVAVCDDNEVFLNNFRKRLADCLHSYGIQTDISVYTDGRAFLERHRKKHFDAVFLDISMPGMDGFEVAGQIRRISQKTVIIFVTVESVLVYDSFDFKPFGFIPKEPEDIFLFRLDRTAKLLADHMTAHRKICLDLAFGEKMYIEPASLISVESHANYIYFRLTDGSSIKVRSKIDDAQKLLPERLFSRIHVRYMVNMQHIRRVDFPNSAVIMDNGHELDISRSFRSSFAETYGVYMRDFS